MYPVLVTCIHRSDSWFLNSKQNYDNCIAKHWHQYPDGLNLSDFIRIPMRSMVTYQCWKALIEAKLVSETAADYRETRWRAVVPPNAYDNGVGILDIDKSRIEIYVSAHKDNPDQSLVLLTAVPVCGPEFDKLPMVARLGIELLWRKECNGHDSE